jgi:hypothetical protein
MKTEIVKIASIGIFNGSITNQYRRKLHVITLSICIVTGLIWTRSPILNYLKPLIDLADYLVNYFVDIDLSETHVAFKSIIIWLFTCLMVLITYFIFWNVFRFKEIIFNPLTKRNIYLIKCETGHLEICISHGIEPPLHSKDKYKNSFKLKNILIGSKLGVSSYHLYDDFVAFFPEYCDENEDLLRRTYFLSRKRIYKHYINLEWNERYITFDCLELKEYLTDNQQIGYRELLRYLINQYINDRHSTNLFSNANLFSNEIEFISDNAYRTFENEVKHLISDENIDYVLSMRDSDHHDVRHTVNEYVLHRLKQNYSRRAVWNYLKSRHPLAELSREALKNEFKV